MIRSLFYIWLSFVIILNSMLFSVIKVNYELNKDFIIENFCINRDEPALQCDGKCFLADQLKAEKEKKGSSREWKFQSDFGIFIQAKNTALSIPGDWSMPDTNNSAYKENKFLTPVFEKDQPPKA